MCRILRSGGYVMLTFDNHVRQFMNIFGEFMHTNKLEICLMEKQEFVGNNGIDTACYSCLLKVL